MIDGVSQGVFSNPINRIASLDLYPNVNSAYYIDDVCYNYDTTQINYLGCTDINGCNYSVYATIDDGGCVYPYLDTIQYTDCQFNVDISMGTHNPYFFETWHDVGVLMIQ